MGTLRVLNLKEKLENSGFYLSKRFSQAMVMVKYDELVSPRVSREFRFLYLHVWVSNTFPYKLVLEVGRLHPASAL